METKTTTNLTDLRVDVDRNEFALTLKTWRLRAGLTQVQAAELLGTNRYAIIKAETAKPISWELAYRLFNLLTKQLAKEASMS